ncbi:uncharacterized protein NEMAJ01_0859 [Nematocida major]|uniref:uncharacterized protein n=1 Tax=Nematocida major TaxID=1912982 RepID=UPI00200813A8|nr:uncharacterized protein NEMAJ01_0859 [Nematocida major]KAH9385963.1 hypothetical protein NEMAJ01_0859 [Nematocida major]
MSAFPPVFHEEMLCRDSGNIHFKVFIDREKSKIHIYACQKESARDYANKLTERVKEILPYKKAYVICNLASAEDIYPVKMALQSCLDQVAKH